VPALSKLPPRGSPPILCYVTDRRSLHPAVPRDLLPALVRKIEAVASAGVDWLQIREKDLSAKELVALTREAVRHGATRADAKQGPTRILVNDRVDVALTEGTGGVHLGEHSLPVKEAKRLVKTHAAREDFLIGVSCHSLEGAKSAASDGADYLFFGPVFATPSKAAFGAPQGLDRLAEVCRSVSIPVLAIGGITVENAAACFAVGASGIAAIRLFQDAPDVAGRITAMRQLAQ
jgi:thiamine-phosphate pyrophosphorylase